MISIRLMAPLRSASANSASRSDSAGDFPVLDAERHGEIAEVGIDEIAVDEAFVVELELVLADQAHGASC